MRNLLILCILFLLLCSCKESVPSPPQSVTITNDISSATIQWAPVTKAASYNIYYSKSSGVNKQNGNIIKDVKSPHSIYGQSDSVPFYYIVTAVNKEGESVESSEVFTQKVSTPKPVISSNTKMLALKGFETFHWGMPKAAATSTAKSFGRVENEPPGLKVFVRGFDEWFELRFSGGKLESVFQRYNNKKKSSPFSEKILNKLKARYGEPTTIENVGDEKVYNWIGKYTKISASHQSSEWYVNVNYTPLAPVESGISTNKKQEVWGYYTQMEDRYGMDKAESMTAKKFKISKDDVVNIKVEGGKGSWALPGEENDVPKYKTDTERQKANQEFGAELYKQGEIIRKRGY